MSPTTYLRRIANYFKKEPDTFILGFQKCGTSSLFQYLIESGIAIGGYPKENDLLFNEAQIHRFKSVYPIYFGDKSVVCASHQLGFIPDTQILLEKYFPRCKKIFILRCPAERAISRYFHNQRKSSTIPSLDRPFASNLDLKEVIRLEKKLIDSNTIYTKKKLYELSSCLNPYGLILGRGLYDIYLKDFLNTPETHILFLEDLATNFNLEFLKLADFLESPKFRLPEPKLYNSAPESQYTINDEILSDLVDFYKPSISRLQEQGINLPKSLKDRYSV